MDRNVLFIALTNAFSETREVPRMDPLSNSPILVRHENKNSLQKTVQNVCLMFGQVQQDEDFPDDVGEDL